MSSDSIKKAADLIRTAYESGTPCAPIRDILPEGDTEAAYAVQEENTKRWLADGRTLVGRKIGLTSAVIQKQLGVDQPDYGMSFVILGHPLRSLVNAARLAAGAGFGLEPGWLILAGAATAAEALRPGVHARTVVEKLGTAELKVRG